jgi:O-antigen/teichoic acid export membrane protein
MSGQVGMVSLRSNMLYALAGWAAPSAVVLASYSVLIRHLGAERFGIFVLAASMSGLLAFLDFGFAAATLKFLAAEHGAGNPRAAGDVIASSLVFYGLLGLGGAAALYFLAPWIVRLLRVDGRLAAEAVDAFRLAGLQFPAFLLIAVLVALFKGLQQFAPAALTLGMLSMVAYGGAAAAVGLAGAGLREVMAISLAAHVVVLAAAAAAAWRLCRALGIALGEARPTRAVFRRMFGFGWLMTANSFSAIFLYQIQRYLVAATLGPAAVAVYQTACACPAKVHQAIAAATEVLFPPRAPRPIRARCGRSTCAC